MSNQKYQFAGDERGLTCSVCWGKGVTELTASQWQHRYTFILSCAFVVLAFGLVGMVSWHKPEILDRILVFIGTLLGSVTGYFFGGVRAGNQSPRRLENRPIQE
jgi:hypothetical protein